LAPSQLGESICASLAYPAAIAFTSWAFMALKCSEITADWANAICVIPQRNNAAKVNDLIIFKSKQLQWIAPNILTKSPLKGDCRKNTLYLSFLPVCFGWFIAQFWVKSDKMEKFEKLEISEDCKIIIANKAMLNGSQFRDVAMTNIKITDANLSDLEIEGAQLGGAYIHNIGMPPKGHPMYDPEARQRPLKFENCDLAASSFTNCDLSGVSLSNCNLAGMTIDGIGVEALLIAYKNK
jgi:hypothetical protein